MTHLLKIAPQFFIAVLERRKTFEVRINDRNYMVGDIVELMEYDENACYTGRVWRGRITYILNDERYVRSGYVIFSIEEI